MSPALKQKFKRLIIMGIVFALFALTGIGFGASSMTLQNRAGNTLQAKLSLKDLPTFSKFLLGMSENEQKTYYVLGVIFGVMGGFCFAAASAIKRQSNE